MSCKAFQHGLTTTHINYANINERVDRVSHKPKSRESFTRLFDVGYYEILVGIRIQTTNIQKPPERLYYNT